MQFVTGGLEAAFSDTEYAAIEVLSPFETIVARAKHESAGSALSASFFPDSHHHQGNDNNNNSRSSSHHAATARHVASASVQPLLEECVKVALVESLTNSVLPATQRQLQNTTSFSALSGSGFARCVLLRLPRNSVLITPACVVVSFWESSADADRVAVAYQTLRQHLASSTFHSAIAQTLFCASFTISGTGVHASAVYLPPVRERIHREFLATLQIVKEKEVEAKCEQKNLGGGTTAAAAAAAASKSRRTDTTAQQLQQQQGGGKRKTNASINSSGMNSPNSNNKSRFIPATPAEEQAMLREKREQKRTEELMLKPRPWIELISDVLKEPAPATATSPELDAAVSSSPLPFLDERRDFSAVDGCSGVPIVIRPPRWCWKASSEETAAATAATTTRKIKAVADGAVSLLQKQLQQALFAKSSAAADDNDELDGISRRRAWQILRRRVAERMPELQQRLREVCAASTAADGTISESDEALLFLVLRKELGIITMTADDSGNMQLLEKPQPQQEQEHEQSSAQLLTTAAASSTSIVRRKLTSAAAAAGAGAVVASSSFHSSSSSWQARWLEDRNDPSSAPLHAQLRHASWWKSDGAVATATISTEMQIAIAAQSDNNNNSAAADNENDHENDDYDENADDDDENAEKTPEEEQELQRQRQRGAAMKQFLARRRAIENAMQLIFFSRSVSSAAGSVLRAREQAHQTAPQQGDDADVVEERQHQLLKSSLPFSLRASSSPASFTSFPSSNQQQQQHSLSQSHLCSDDHCIRDTACSWYRFHRSAQNYADQLFESTRSTLGSFVPVLRCSVEWAAAAVLMLQFVSNELDRIEWMRQHVEEGGRSRSSVAPLPSLLCSIQSLAVRLLLFDGAKSQRVLQQQARQRIEARCAGSTLFGSASSAPAARHRKIIAHLSDGGGDEQFAQHVLEELNVGRSAVLTFFLRSDPLMPIVYEENNNNNSGSISVNSRSRHCHHNDNNGDTNKGEGGNYNRKKSVGGDGEMEEEDGSTRLLVQHHLLDALADRMVPDELSRRSTEPAHVVNVTEAVSAVVEQSEDFESNALRALCSQADRRAVAASAQVRLRVLERRALLPLAYAAIKSLFGTHHRIGETIGTLLAFRYSPLLTLVLSQEIGATLQVQRAELTMPRLPQLAFTKERLLCSALSTLYLLCPSLDFTQQYSAALEQQTRSHSTSRDTSVAESESTRASSLAAVTAATATATTPVPSNAVVAVAPSALSLANSVTSVAKFNTGLLLVATDRLRRILFDIFTFDRREQRENDSASSSSRVLERLLFEELPIRVLSAALLLRRCNPDWLGSRANDINNHSNKSGVSTRDSALIFVMSLAANAAKNTPRARCAAAAKIQQWLRADDKFNIRVRQTKARRMFEREVRTHKTRSEVLRWKIAEQEAGRESSLIDGSSGALRCEPLRSVVPLQARRADCRDDGGGGGGGGGGNGGGGGGHHRINNNPLMLQIEQSGVEGQQQQQHHHHHHHHQHHDPREQPSSATGSGVHSTASFGGDGDGGGGGGGVLISIVVDAPHAAATADASNTSTANPFGRDLMSSSQLDYSTDLMSASSFLRSSATASVDDSTNTQGGGRSMRQRRRFNSSSGNNMMNNSSSNNLFTLSVREQAQRMRTRLEGTENEVAAVPHLSIAVAERLCLDEQKRRRAREKAEAPEWLHLVQFMSEELKRVSETPEKRGALMIQCAWRCFVARTEMRMAILRRMYRKK